MLASCVLLLLTIAITHSSCRVAAPQSLQQANRPTHPPTLFPLPSLLHRYALRPAPLVFPPSVADVVRIQVHDPALHSTHTVTPQRAGALLDQVAAAAAPNLSGPAASGPWQPALRVYFKESLVTGSDKPGRWALTTWPPFPEQVRRLCTAAQHVG